MELSWPPYGGSAKKYRVSVRASMKGELLGALDNLVEPCCDIPEMVNGVGFFPASGAALMHPDKRGIFRVSIEVEEQRQ
jgi:hypothetical protein